METSRPTRLSSAGPGRAGPAQIFAVSPADRHGPEVEEFVAGFCTPVFARRFLRAGFCASQNTYAPAETSRILRGIFARFQRMHRFLARLREKCATQIAYLGPESALPDAHFEEAAQRAPRAPAVPADPAPLPPLPDELPAGSRVRRLQRVHHYHRFQRIRPSPTSPPWSLPVGCGLAGSPAGTWASTETPGCL